MDKTEANGNTPDLCLECGGKCCVGIIDVYSNDEVFYDDNLVHEEHGLKFDKVMRIVDNKCIALVNSRCNIYDKRPQVCREFQMGGRCCLNLKTGKIKIHSCVVCDVTEKL